MDGLIDSYLRYIANVRRYSERTLAIYRDVLSSFESYACPEGTELCSVLNATAIRNYEVHLLDERKLGARTVNLHLSVLSGFCKFLIKEGRLRSNPVHLVNRPKQEKRLPEFYREDSMAEYFNMTAHAASRDELDLLKSFGSGSGDKLATELYKRRLHRLIVSILHNTAIRRSELIGLQCSSADLQRGVLRVRGKGDKTREIPLVPSLCEELELYRQAVLYYFSDSFHGNADSPLLLTPTGRKLYPVYVDKAVKSELQGVGGITGRKSPHVLRHTLATELLNDGADLNSIKEFLGHSSLAATQVYTHNSIEKLKSVYSCSHPRAKKK
ncbi:MAG: tyrosine-type recombinase/integrase [Bacteroidales bacterium]|nr:tyrosine-type recombinase/integrase [Bacteroidales bacterium]